MIVIATYPRSMSAWLSNFLTVPGRSLYLHDALYFPELMEVLDRAPYEYKGVVDTLGEEVPDGSRIVVVDNDVDRVKEKCAKWGSTDLSRVEGNIADLKQRADWVVHLDDMDTWIGALFEVCTGKNMDWVRYKVLKDINMQSNFAMKLDKEGL